MGRRCIIAGCSNTCSKFISLHRFPSKEKSKIRQLWINFVKQTRAKWNEPSEYSEICSAHFTDDCFVRNDVKYSLGFSNRYLRKNVDKTFQKH